MHLNIEQSRQGLPEKKINDTPIHAKAVLSFLFPHAELCAFYSSLNILIGRGVNCLKQPGISGSNRQPLLLTALAL